jgi:hypothetical protein
MSNPTKSKIAFLIEKHIITTKIQYLLNELNNCEKTENVREIDKTAVYITQTTNQLDGSKTDPKYYMIGLDGVKEDITEKVKNPQP